jgi:transposase
VDGAGNHRDELEVPANIMLHLLPPYSPELNPQENLWDEIREKIFKDYALKSMDCGGADSHKLDAKIAEAALYIERNPALVKSITSFPYIAKSILWYQECRQQQNRPVAVTRGKPVSGDGLEAGLIEKRSPPMN